MNIRDPEFQKISLVTTFLVGVLYVFFFTTYLPFTFKSRRLQMAETRQKYERVQADVTKARAAVERLPELEREVAAIHERWEEVSELLPSSKEVAGFLTRLTVAGQESGVDFKLVEPQPAVDHEFYLAYPTRVEVDGGFHAVGRFLAEVGNAARIVQVRNLRLAAADGGGEGERVVTASFVAEAYASKDDVTGQPTVAASP